MTTSSIDVRRAADRFHTVEGGIDSWHCFSFAKHYDPANTSFGPLVAHNDTVLQPGSGFAPHRHANLEIVTWVVRGVLRHEDSTGRLGEIQPGDLQRLSAGAGVVHSERAADLETSPPPSSASTDASTDASTRFVQMWVAPDQFGGRASYAQRFVDTDALAAGLVVVASGRTEPPLGAVTLARRGAALLAGRLAPGQTHWLTGTELIHLYVVSGEVELESGQLLEEGDSARLRSASGLGVSGVKPAEILVWEMDLA
jgi:redox-sensitive bicupin YhaK (pirin superfamily)